MRILVTGTPGVGKTTLSRRIVEATGIKYICITDYVKRNNLYTTYCGELDTYVFDETVVHSHLLDSVYELRSFVIDTHSPSVASGIPFDIIFHVHCSTSELFDRLAARDYSVEKITENIDCEIFNVIGEDLEDYFEGCNVVLVNGSSVADESPVADDMELIAFDDAIRLVSKKYHDGQ